MLYSRSTGSYWAPWLFVYQCVIGSICWYCYLCSHFRRIFDAYIYFCLVCFKGMVSISLCTMGDTPFTIYHSVLRDFNSLFWLVAILLQMKINCNLLKSSYYKFPAKVKHLLHTCNLKICTLVYWYVKAPLVLSLSEYVLVLQGILLTVLYLHRSLLFWPSLW